MKEFIFKYKFIIIAIAVLTTFLIGGTYAWVNLEIFGTKTNRVAAGTLSIELDESACENITTTNAYPLSDEEGLKQVACTFSVENTGSLDSVYSVFLDDIEIEADEERMPDASMKYALKRNDGSPTIRTLDTTITDSERLLDSRIIKVGESNSYELRFWIKEDAGVEAMNKVFYTNLRVVANLDTPKPVIDNISDYYVYRYVDELDIFGDGSSIPSVDANHVSLTDDFKNAIFNNETFTDSKGNMWNPGDPLPNPGRTYTEGDVEKNIESMSFMFFDKGYYNATDKASYPKYSLDLSLWDTSGISSFRSLFSSSAAEAIDLSGFNTSKAVDMNGMFHTSAAEEIDLSNFDTSNVTDMTVMFYKSSASVIDVSSFNTGKVASMYAIFSYSNATLIDLSGFDTSTVTDMGYMFYYSNSSVIDVSGFDTSNVVNMTHMFSRTKANEIDVGNFDTSKVTNMSYMFNNTIVDTINLDNFNTSKVTDMRFMFSYTTFPSLDLRSFDTGNTVDMEGMFAFSEFSSLNLSSFNTSNVTNMNGMFNNSKNITSLDLSSFDIGAVTSMTNIFGGGNNANPIYVKDQISLDKFVSLGSAASSKLQIK